MPSVCGGNFYSFHGFSFNRKSFPPNNGLVDGQYISLQQCYSERFTANSHLPLNT